MLLGTPTAGRTRTPFLPRHQSRRQLRGEGLRPKVRLKKDKPYRCPQMDFKNVNLYNRIISYSKSVLGDPGGRLLHGKGNGLNLLIYFLFFILFTITSFTVKCTYLHLQRQLGSRHSGSTNPSQDRT